MQAIDYFYKKSKDIIRKHQGQNEDQTAAALRDHLLQNLGDLPNMLVQDVFQYYWERYLQKEPENRSFYDLVESFLPIVSFLWGDPPDELDFSSEEWAMIREALNASADTMDLVRLNDLMKILVDKGEY